MNFLAHCVLARTHPDLLVGGYLGDFIKGPVPEDLPGRVADGIRLHRRLDAYSAHQPHIKRSVSRLPDNLRRVAPIFIDLVADHVLARQFEALEGETLESFADHAYTTLEQARHLLDDRARRFLDVMRQHDLLSGYAQARGVERAFVHIAGRLSRPEIVAPAMHTLKTDYLNFELDFSEYYPDLKRHTSDWLENRPAQA